jgi:hypothetical protein
MVHLDHFSLQQATLEAALHLTAICRTTWHLLTQWQQLIIGWDQLWNTNSSPSNERIDSECVKKLN